MKKTVMGETLYVWLNLSYLEIPVLAKLQIPSQGSIKPNIFAGPAIGLKLSGSVKAKYAGETETENIEDLKGMDLGLVIGGGVDYLMGNKILTVDLRYTLGLGTISDYEGEDVKNGVFSILFGILF
jgi:hypothetical protein